ncbi:hypothetical protein GOV13_02770 [Candidatus Pacearchaeota archaeon]|nr:hypothetical protein [Candidatus Pacearchaeota archaeon]
MVQQLGHGRRMWSMGITKPKPIARVRIDNLEAKREEQKSKTITIYRNAIKNARQVEQKIKEALE